MQEPVVLAHVARARGLAGEVVIRGEPDELALVTAADEVQLTRRDDPEVTRTHIERVSGVRDGLAVRFEGVDDRAAAEALRGASIAIDVAQLPQPSVSSWAWVQIRGFEVVTTDGRRLGVANERIRTGAADVLVVLGEDEREVLVPASPNVLMEIDGAERRIVIEAIPGLLELNE